MENSKGVHVLLKKTVKRKRQQHKIPRKGTTACRMSGLGSMSLKGRLTNGSFCSAEVQQKRGCLSGTLKDGKNLDMQREWGGEGIAGGRGWLAEVKVRRVSKHEGQEDTDQ